MKITRRQLRRLIFESLEGKPGEWQYEIVSIGNYDNIDSLNPDDVKDVIVKVVSGPSNIGYQFPLSQIQSNEGNNEYQNHPLVHQVIEKIKSGNIQNPIIQDNIQNNNTNIDINNLKVLFVGDSQTYYPGASYAWKILSKPNITGDNISKNGASLRKIKSFLSQGLKKDKYDIITIMGGGNNSRMKNPPYYLYDEMYKMSKDSGAIVVAITNPTKNNLDDSKRNKYPTNEKLAEHVRNSNIPDIIIDANLLLSYENDFGKDKIHLNSNAHDKLKNYWLTEVSKYISNKS